ncbi:MAG: precorrin-6A/cobalt-precorrin-6A reductase [Rhodospirillales bacterium]
MAASAAPQALTDYLRDAGIDLLIDATHPFAVVISQAAAEACTARGIPRLMLVRPAWMPQPGDDWHAVASLEEAAARCLGSAAGCSSRPGRQRRLRALPRSGSCCGCSPKPSAPLPLARCTTIIAPPPFTLEGEAALLARHRIEALVCKNSGGPTQAKLAAARTKGLPVIILRRPRLPEGERAAGPEEALTWLRERVVNA